MGSNFVEWTVDIRGVGQASVEFPAGGEAQSSPVSAREWSGLAQNGATVARASAYGK